MFIALNFSIISLVQVLNKLTKYPVHSKRSRDEYTDVSVRKVGMLVEFCKQTHSSVDEILTRELVLYLLLLGFTCFSGQLFSQTTKFTL